MWDLIVSVPDHCLSFYFSVGDFTCTTSRGQNVVDYVLVSRDLLKMIETFEVGDPSILSDHSLISFSLRTESYTDFVNQNNATRNMDGFADYRYVWDAGKVDDFKERLRSRNCTQMLDQMKSELEQSILLSLN